MSLSGMFPIENSDFYRVWIEEQEHIEKNKWYLSEKLKRDVSRNEAIWDWITQHREKWISGLKEQGKYPTL